MSNIAIENTLGKVAVVTGANRGLGFATVKLLSKLGFCVFAGCRDIEAGRKVFKDLSDESLEIYPLELDISKLCSVTEFCNVVLESKNRIDILVNNAAVYLEKNSSFLEIDEDTLVKSLDVNVCGAWRMCKLIGPVMIRQGYGRIVNVSTGWASMAEMEGNAAAYRISKAGLNALTKTVADELSNKGDIKVNAICPGWIQTRMGGDQAPRKPIDAAEDIVWAATLDNDGPTGEFFRGNKKIAW